MGSAGLNIYQVGFRLVSQGHDHDLIFCRNEDKLAGLVWLIREIIPAGQPTLIFVATRHHVELLQTLLAQEELDAACVYGTMDQVRHCMWSHQGISGKAVQCSSESLAKLCKGLQEARKRVFCHGTSLQ